MGWLKNRHWLRLRGCILAAMAVWVLAASAASAHTGGTLGGFISGFEHPILGPDHLLAMFAVGVWGAQIGGSAIWELPVVFPLIMAIGGVLGVMGLAFPHVEAFVAASVVGLGLAIALIWRPAHLVGVAFVGLFALFHGYAHGVELPRAADPSAYGLGFVVATGTIHCLGIGFGLGMGDRLRGGIGRTSGALIAFAGLWFLARLQ